MPMRSGSLRSRTRDIVRMDGHVWSYRDCFTHSAPLHEIEGSSWAIQDLLTLKDGKTVPQIYYPLPRMRKNFHVGGQKDRSSRPSKRWWRMPAGNANDLGAGRLGIPPHLPVSIHGAGSAAPRSLASPAPPGGHHQRRTSSERSKSGLNELTGITQCALLL